MLNAMINKLDTFLQQHPSIDFLVGLIGLSVIGVISALVKLISKSKKKRNNIDLQTTVSNPSDRVESAIENDIKTINKSIQYDLGYKQKEVFLRYFNKYKSKLPQPDIEQLEYEYNHSHSYSSLLSKLLGLIESLQ